MANNNKTAHIPFVLGGKILDRRYPSILEPNPNASARRNRTISYDDWTAFCDEFEAAMSWSRNWPICFFQKGVLLCSSLWISSFVLLILTRETNSPPNDNIYGEYANHSTAEEIGSYSYISNHTSGHYSPQGYYQNSNNNFPQSTASFVKREIIPDACVLLLLITVIALAISLVQLSFHLQQAVEEVCQQFTEKYHSFYGISFGVTKKPTLASPPWRRHGSALGRRRTNESFQSFIEITKESEDISTRYQNVDNPSSWQYQKQFHQHPEHPKDEMGEPPFFDVARVPNTTLLPPQAQLSRAMNERS